MSAATLTAPVGVLAGTHGAPTAHAAHAPAASSAARPLAIKVAEGTHSRLVALAALANASIAVVWAYLTGSMTLYNDAASHLFVSRRILDSLTPGLGQIGTTWLPLPHLLLQPFIYVDALYFTGLAAAFLGVICTVVTGVCTYRLCYLLTSSERAALVGAGVVVLNPNLLYIQTTALTEPVLLATFAFAAYYLCRWTMTFAIGDLALAAAGTFCAALSRYDGWALIMAGSAITLAVGLVSRRNRAFAEGSLFAFASLAGYSVVLWTLYQWMLFGDPLYSIRNPFSAQAQQKELFDQGMLATKGNLLFSFTEFCWTVAYNMGYAVCALGVIGLAVYAITRWRSATVFSLLFLLTPFAFNIVALYVGQTVIWPHGKDGLILFNVRYGLMGLLPLAAGVAILAGRLTFRGIGVGLVAAAVLAQSAWLVAENPIVLKDGQQGMSAAERTRYEAAAAWLRENYAGGTVLIDPYWGAPTIYRSGLPVRSFVHDGTQTYWNQALDDPSRVDYAVAFTFKQDRITGAIKNNRSALANFEQHQVADGVLVLRYAGPNAAQTAKAQSPAS